MSPGNNNGFGNAIGLRADWLLYSGWFIMLTYFPSGLLHFYMSVAVYLRDIFAVGHLILCFVFFHLRGELREILRRYSILLLVPFFLLPAIFYHQYTLEALRTIKWSILWLDWIFVGYLAFYNRNWDECFKIFLAITLLELLIEAGVGMYEWHTNEFLFSPPWGEKTALGVLEVSDLRLIGHVRVRGLQRDVFSFANLMAMSATCGLVYAVSFARSVGEKLLGYVWAAFFAIPLVLSGGRSALFGIFAAVILALALTFDPVRVRRFAKAYLLLWVLIGLSISLVGVGSLTESIGSGLFGGSHIGDSTSAYMRDDNWRNILSAFATTPLILIIGGPFASLLDSSVAPMFHWADNQFLWDLYHLGIAGFLGVGFYFFVVVKKSSTRGDPRAMDALILFLLLVIGEGIARESLTFMSCGPVFVACGYVSAAGLPRGRSPEDSSSSSRHSRRRRRKKTADQRFAHPNA